MEPTCAQLIEDGYNYAKFCVKHHGYFWATNRAESMRASTHFREGFKFYLDTHKEG